MPFDFDRFFPNRVKKPFFIDPADPSALTFAQRGAFKRFARTSTGSEDWVVEARTPEQAVQLAAQRLRVAPGLLKATGST